MGYSAYSYVVYGIRVKHSDLTFEEVERGCSHPETKSKFCGECGKPMFVHTEYSLIPALEEQQHQGMLSIYYSDHERFTRPNHEAILGYCLGRTSYERDCSIVRNISDEMTKNIFDFCKEHRIACDTKDLHTFVMTYHSY